MGMTASETRQRNEVLRRLLQRADCMGWRNSRTGKWTTKGETAALDFICGAAAACECTGQENVMNALLLLGMIGSARGSGTVAQTTLAKSEVDYPAAA